MNVTRKIKLLIVITANFLLISCADNKQDFDIVTPEKDKPVDKYNPTDSRPINVEDDLIKNNTSGDKQNNQIIIEDSDSVEYNLSNHTYYTNVTESKNTTFIKPQVKEKIVTDSSGSSSNNVNISDSKEEVEVSVEPSNKDIKEDPEIPKDNSSEINQPPIDKDPPNKDEITVLCKDAWFDESMPCDYILDNLKPTDELGRSVPHFFTSQEAWNWGEQQIEDEDSEYGCRGFSRMDGYQNDGTQFFFAYLKVCDIN